jgi:hypothetical protein
LVSGWRGCCWATSTPASPPCTWISPPACPAPRPWTGRRPPSDRPRPPRTGSLTVILDGNLNAALNSSLTAAAALTDNLTAKLNRQLTGGGASGRLLSFAIEDGLIPSR